MVRCGGTIEQTHVFCENTKRANRVCREELERVGSIGHPQFFAPRRNKNASAPVFESRAVGPECEACPREQLSCRCLRLVATLQVFGSRV